MPEPYFVIKSYKRAGQVSTLAVAPFAYIWVPESQGDAYREHYGDRVVGIPDDADGNLCRKQNSILDRAPSEWVVILDDDISRIGYWEGGKHVWAKPDQFQHMAANMFRVCTDLDVELWGMNQKMDPLAYRTLCPFSFLAPILGPLHGHLHASLRYDEAALTKDDYDFWLQNIHKFHRTFRNNKWHYVCDHGKQAGGAVSQRTLEVEQAGVDYMLKKWGREVFRAGGQRGGKSATGKNILNSVVHVPIAGT